MMRGDGYMQSVTRLGLVEFDKSIEIILHRMILNERSNGRREKQDLFGTSSRYYG